MTVIRVHQKAINFQYPSSRHHPKKIYENIVKTVLRFLWSETCRKNYGGYKKILLMKCTNSIDDMGVPCRTHSIQDLLNLRKESKC